MFQGEFALDSACNIVRGYAHDLELDKSLLKAS